MGTGKRLQNIVIPFQGHCSAEGSQEDLLRQNSLRWGFGAQKTRRRHHSRDADVLCGGHYIFHLCSTCWDRSWSQEETYWKQGLWREDTIERELLQILFQASKGWKAGCQEAKPDLKYIYLLYKEDIYFFCHLLYSMLKVEEICSLMF